MLQKGTELICDMNYTSTMRFWSS